MREAVRRTGAIGDAALNSEFFAKVNDGDLLVASQALPFFAKVNDGDLSVASQALPVAAGILGLQLVHELAHRLAALASGKKKEAAGTPCVHPLSPELFVVTLKNLLVPPVFNPLCSVAGPALGAAVSLGALIGGLLLTGGATADALAAFPVVPAALFHSSATIGTITSIALPQAMLQALSTPVPLHPLAVIGLMGVIVNALNLMPVGRLDGERLAAAGFGRRTAAVLGTLTLLLQIVRHPQRTAAIITHFLDAASAIFNNHSLQLFWGLAVIIFQRGQDLPATRGEEGSLALHEGGTMVQVSEFDEGRNTVLLVLLAFALFTLVPFPSL
ncbi:hypothetical protein JKP88DRAFT_274966 [Tribonema minus]|uniref:Peptidase M50 domain-containing protein n=1 Tax=Tribonema minus TaxID=303371 RepID=A0A835ZNX7_9STRA|nr:hypothetical protein JKP88DRAFT_274966 [Tribonema minus]